MRVLRRSWSRTASRSRCGCVLLLFGLAGCGTSTPSPPGSPAPAPAPSTVSGRETLGWTQATDDLTGYAFSIYVDGQKRDAPDAFCGTPATAGFECRAALPEMSTGIHTLQVSATVKRNGEVIEGPKSAPLTVTLDATAATGDSLRIGATDTAYDSSRASGTRGGGTEHRESSRCGLSFWNERTGAAWTSRGDLWLVTDDDVRQPLAWRQPDDDEWRLSGAARDRDVEGSRFAFLTLTRHEARGDWLRVARYRKAGGTLGERAILLEQRLAFAPTATSTAIDPDGRLIVALLGPSTVPPAEHSFVIRISRDGAAVRVEPDPFEMAAPIAVALAPSGALAAIEPSGSNASRLRIGDAMTTVHLPALPIALQRVMVDDVERLAVVAADGSAFTITDAGGIRPLAAPASATPLQGALLFSGGTSLGCTTSLDSLMLLYGRWRG